jgi:hypothetical protein
MKLPYGCRYGVIGAIVSFGLLSPPLSLPRNDLNPNRHHGDQDGAQRQDSLIFVGYTDDIASAGAA